MPTTKTKLNDSGYAWNRYIKLDNTVTYSVDSLPLVNRVSYELNPMWEALIQTNKEATTPLTGFSTSIGVDNRLRINAVRNGVNNLVITETGYSAHVQNNAMSLSSSDLNTVAVAQAKAQCLARFNRWVAERQTPFQAQVALGELRETLKFIKNPLATTHKVTEAFMKKVRRNSTNGQDVANQIKALSELWLEYRFAILPLVSDINELLQVYLERNQWVERQRFYGSSDSITSSTFTGSASYFSTQVGYKRNLKAECIIHTGVQWGVTERFAGLGKYLEDSLADFAQLGVTAWELTPYSFLVDYFVNVGDVVQALIPANFQLNYKAESNILTKISDYKVLSYSIPGSLSKIVYTGDRENACQISARKVVRTVLASTVPPIVVNLPGNIQLANISALIASRLLGKP